MAKALLVINKPDNCCECPFMSGVHGDHYCQMGDDGNCNCSVTGGQRPDWCPLIPEPERMTEWAKEQEEAKGRDYVIGMTDGWNACIDALEGEGFQKRHFLSE